ncbi:MAG: peptide deformylase [Saprospiraceae bacterium]
MILPIYAYGHPVLKQVATDIEPGYPNLQELIANMWETMYNADGVGLAAPQIGLSVRIFMVDTTQIQEKGNEAAGIKRTFINAHKVEESGDPWTYEEGCLSIPKVRGDVERPPMLRLRWVDENFEPHEETFVGINARVIQHEYDHIDGVLFVDHLKPVKKHMVRKKLEDIRRGKIAPEYRMRFAK